MTKISLKEDIPTRNMKFGNETAHATTTGHMLFRDF